MQTHASRIFPAASWLTACRTARNQRERSVMSSPLPNSSETFDAAAAMAIDSAVEAKRIEEFLRSTVRNLNRRGLVLGVSGGVDSAVCAHLAVRALGPE